VDLDPVAIELDFVKPPVTRGRLGFEGGELGLNESRHLQRLDTRHLLDPTKCHPLGNLAAGLHHCKLPSAYLMRLSSRPFSVRRGYSVVPLVIK
jgi:hypothetical protein